MERKGHPDTGPDPDPDSDPDPDPDPDPGPGPGPSPGPAFWLLPKESCHDPKKAVMITMGHRSFGITDRAKAEALRQ